MRVLARNSRTQEALSPVCQGRRRRKTSLKLGLQRAYVPDMKREVKFFVSYARLNQKCATDLIERLEQQLRPSRAYDYALWRDTALVVGENWDEDIRVALAEADVGLLLITPAFLGSNYITKVELPALLQRPVLPVLLEPVHPARQDMHGLDAKQIFGLSVQGGHRRAFVDCRPGDRRKFVEVLFDQIERRLDRLAATMSPERTT